MAAHTANPGRVYFAAGSFEPEDFPGGRVDLHRNMVREVLEETGIDIVGTAARPAPPRACDRNRGTVIFRRYHLDAAPKRSPAASARLRRRGGGSRRSKGRSSSAGATTFPPG